MQTVRYQQNTDLDTRAVQTFGGFVLVSKCTQFYQYQQESYEFRVLLTAHRMINANLSEISFAILEKQLKHKFIPMSNKLLFKFMSVNQRTTVSEFLVSGYTVAIKKVNVKPIVTREDKLLLKSVSTHINATSAA